MGRVAALLVLVSLAGAQDDKTLLDLTPRWTAGETYRRTYEFSLDAGEDLEFGVKRVFLDRVLTVRDGAPVFVTRTYETHRVTGAGRSALEGKTVRLTVRDAEGIKLVFDDLLAKNGVRVGDSWTRTGRSLTGVPHLRPFQVSCEVVRRMDFEGHPAVEVKIDLRGIAVIRRTAASLEYSGHLYFATDVAKPLLVDIKGPVTAGTRRGTSRIVMRLEPLPEQVEPRELPAAPGEIRIPRESTAKEALLKPRWRAGEESTVEIAVIASHRLGGGAMTGTQRTDVVYGEKVLHMEGDRAQRVERTYTKHLQVRRQRMGGKEVPSALMNHPMRGKTFTFVRTGGSFEPSKPLPKSALEYRPLDGADWELVLPNRVVRLGERWRPGFDVRVLGVSAMRLRLVAIRGSTAYIRTETARAVGGDIKWEPSGVLTFSLEHGKVTASDLKIPSVDPRRSGPTIVQTVRRFE